MTEDTGNGNSEKIKKFREHLDETVGDSNDGKSNQDADPKYAIQELQARLDSQNKRIKILERDIGRAAKRVKQLEDENEKLKEEKEELEEQLEESNESPSNDEIQERLEKQRQTLKEQFNKKQKEFEENLRQDVEKERKELIQKVQEQTADEVRKASVKQVTQLFFEVRDNLVRALEQDESTNIRPGVEATLSKFDDVLQTQGINIINPEKGSDIDPNKHEVVGREESDQSDGTIARVYRHGYETPGNVIRTAQVAVSTGNTTENEENTEQIEEDEPEGSEPSQSDDIVVDEDGNIVDSDVEKIAEELESKITKEEIELEFDEDN